ncbi:MAG TPA: ATP-binding protein [Gemmatimonadaceae bacterium]
MSLTVLIGWTIGARALQSFIPGWVTMKPNAALGLGLAAVSLLLSSASVWRPRSALDWWARAFAVAVFVIGALTLAEYLFGLDLRIDQLLFRAGADQRAVDAPGRMALVTALAFALLGISLALARRGPRTSYPLAQPVALLAAALSLAALLGHLYGAIAVVGAGQGIQIAPHTAIGVFLLASAALTFEMRGGWLRTLLSPRPGGIMARRLLPVALGVPLALGALRLTGQWFHLSGAAVASATVAVLTMFAFGVVIWRAARALNEADTRARALEEEQIRLALREVAAQTRADAEHAARKEAVGLAREKAEALALLDLVFDSSPVAVAQFDRDLRLQRANRAFDSITARTTESTVGEIAAHVGLRQFAVIEAECRRVLESGEPITNAERTVADARGRKRRHWLSSKYPVRTPHGEIIGVGLTIVEVTERRQLEEQLRQSQKMEAVGQLAAGVAHDFNNVLTAIRSFSELIALDLEPGSAVGEDLSEITAAADRAAALTRRLLAFSRQQVLQPAVLDPNAVVDNLTKMLGRLLGGDVRCEVALAANVGRVLADPGQLEQVLMNLAVNARDAMPDGGTLTIETANSEVDGAETGQPVGPEKPTPGEYVMLVVSDTGHGMDASTLSRIFEPFFTTKEPGKGTGLGLSTVYGIVKQSGGHIQVYSEPGRGTTFRVYLPRVAGDPAPSLVPTRPAPTAGKAVETILLVDDDDAVRSVAGRILARVGYTVLSAGSAEEAKALWGSHRGKIDLLVTDLMMPDMNGGELAHQLLELRPGTPVLYTSGFTNETVIRRGLVGTGTPFLAKPFTIDDLQRKIRDAIEAGRMGSVSRSEGSRDAPRPRMV